MEQETSSSPGRGRIDDLLTDAEEALQAISRAFSKDEAATFADSPEKVTDRGGPHAEKGDSSLGFQNPSSLSPTVPTAPRYLEIELGRCRLPLSKVLTFGSGTILPLSERADGLVGLYYGEKKVAEGILLIDRDHLAVRVTKIFREETLAQQAEETARR